MGLPQGNATLQEPPAQCSASRASLSNRDAEDDPAALRWVVIMRTAVRGFGGEADEYSGSRQVMLPRLAVKNAIPTSVQQGDLPPSPEFEERPLGHANTARPAGWRVSLCSFSMDSAHPSGSTARGPFGAPSQWRRRSRHPQARVERARAPVVSQSRWGRQEERPPQRTSLVHPR